MILDDEIPQGEFDTRESIANSIRLDAWRERVRQHLDQRACDRAKRAISAGRALSPTEDIAGILADEVGIAERARHGSSEIGRLRQRWQAASGRRWWQTVEDRRAEFAEEQYRAASAQAARLQALKDLIAAKSAEESAPSTVVRIKRSRK